MAKITTFITYNNQAEEATKLYTSLFKDSRIKNITRAPDAVPGQGGKVMTVEFELAGQPYVAMNGGPSFKFAEGISLSVSCEDQAEIDRLWERLTADGGKPGPCGWLTDKFGVYWQVTPTALMQMEADPDRQRAARVLSAMQKMKKIIIADLERAYRG